MSNSIFEKTMADMNWMEIQHFAEKKAIVLLPLGVIEEHGPHMCLGTDVYLACTQSLLVKEKLINKEITAIVAPPFYWGINKATGNFPGSFTSRKETVKAMIFDILLSLSNFGFKDIFSINVHGDPVHCQTLMEAFKEATEKIHINACFTIPQGSLERYDLIGDESYILPIEPQTVEISKLKYADIHAGASETAKMYKYHSEMVDIYKAKKLPSTILDGNDLLKWIDGSKTRTLTPDGYVGAPADYVYVDAESDYQDTANRIAKAIISRIV